MCPAPPPRDTDNAMLPRQITHQNIFRVLMAGFTLVIVLLVAAAIVGIQSIQSIQENANSLVREQSLTNRLIDELHSQQTTLSEVFSVLARDPDSVDYYKIMSQLDEADRDIAIGFVQLAHDLVVVHRIGIACQHGKDFAEGGLLAVQLVDQAVGEGLLPHHAVGILLDGLNTANADNGRSHQQHDHQGEAGHQDPEDVLVGDLPW